MHYLLLQHRRRRRLYRHCRLGILVQRFQFHIDLHLDRYLHQNHADLVKEVGTSGKLDAAPKAKLDQAIQDHLKTFSV